jgi:tetratricopeptide (TPR) repeat protein
VADAEIEIGECENTELTAREAQRILAVAEESWTATFAMSEGILARALRSKGDYAGAKTTAEHAIAVARKTMSRSDPRLASLLTDYAQVLEETGDVRLAQALCVQAVDIFESNGEGNGLSLASAYQNLAVVYTSQGKLKKALDAVSSALTAWNRELPPNHPFLVDALATKIVIYGRLKSLPQAEAIIPETLELSLSRFGPDNPVRAILLSNVAEIYIAEKKYREAELCFARPPNYTGGISRTAIPC